MSFLKSWLCIGIMRRCHIYKELYIGLHVYYAVQRNYVKAFAVST